MSLKFLTKITTTHFYCVITIFAFLLICWHCLKVQEGLDEECNCNCDGQPDEDGNVYDENGNLMSGPGTNYSKNPAIKAVVKKNQMVDAIRKLLRPNPNPLPGPDQKNPPSSDCSAATTCKECGAADANSSQGAICYWCSKANDGKGGCFDTSIEPDNCPPYSMDCTSEDCKNYGSSGSGCPV